MEEKDTVITCINFNGKYVAWRGVATRKRTLKQKEENTTSKVERKQNTLNLTELSEFHQWMHR